MRISTRDPGRLERRNLASGSQPQVRRSDSRWSLFKRKGGGGGHASSGGRSSSSRSSSSKGGSSSSAAAKHGASTKFTSSRSGGSFSLSTAGLSKSTASAYSDGGGGRTTLGSTSAFNGRQAGGGSRSTVYGTSRFGSGYPYGSYGNYVDSRPAPYYFYPTPPANNYYGGDEYLNVSEAMRPGGALLVAIVQPSWNTSEVTYRLVGDNVSVTAVFDALIANCSVANSSSAISAFSPSPSTWPLPEQIVQWYRASTFALSLDGYNNTAALPANMPASNTSAPNNLPDTPLPAGLNMTFLECVNTTTGASVPLVDVPSHNLSTDAIAGIAVASFFAFLVLVWLASWCWEKIRGCWGRRGDWGKSWKKRWNVRKSSKADDVPEVTVLDPSEKEALTQGEKPLEDDRSSFISVPPSYHEKEPDYPGSPSTPSQSWVSALKPEPVYTHVRAGSSSSLNSSPRSSMEFKHPDSRWDESAIGRHASPFPMPMPSSPKYTPHSWRDPFDH